MDAIAEDVRSGARLYGDDMDADQIGAWYADEEHGFFDLASDWDGTYGYAALNAVHAYDMLAQRRFRTCVALGVGAGHDVEAIAPNVDHFYGIEPAEKWWTDSIAGTPATFLKPTIMGDIALPDASVDLATSMGVLHHIPNVGHVIDELARVLEPGGLLVLREPCNSMGDWRKPRTGLTRRERGIPTAWLDARLRAAGLKLIRRRTVMFSLTPRIFRIHAPYNSRLVVLLDWMLATAFSWNNHYWRDSIAKKIGPTGTFIVAEKI